MTEVFSFDKPVDQCRTTIRLSPESSSKRVPLEHLSLSKDLYKILSDLILSYFVLILYKIKLWK